MTVETHPQGQAEPTFQKKAWDAPKLAHFQAGSAEAVGNGQTDFTTDFS
jgi:hypothetical protein